MHTVGPALGHYLWLSPAHTLAISVISLPVAQFEQLWSILCERSIGHPVTYRKTLSIQSVTDLGRPPVYQLSHIFFLFFTLASLNAVTISTATVIIACLQCHWAGEGLQRYLQSCPQWRGRQCCWMPSERMLLCKKRGLETELRVTELT